MIRKIQTVERNQTGELGYADYLVTTYYFFFIPIFVTKTIN